MTKKHFERIAETLNCNQHLFADERAYYEFCTMFGYMCYDFNRRFDSQKFFETCYEGLPQPIEQKEMYF